MRSWVWVWVMAAGCAGEADDGTVTCVADAAEGAIEARLDGEAWEADATWTEAGDGVQVVSTTTGGWRLTIAAQQAGVAIEVGDFPVVIDLAGDEGFVTAYPASGDASFSSSGGAGTLTFVGLDAGVLSGCFSAEAVSAEGEQMELREGMFAAGIL